MTPTVQYARKRVERRGVSFNFLDQMVLDIEAEYGFQVNPMTGKSYADEELCEARQRAWHRTGRASVQLRNIERLAERRRVQRERMAALLDEQQRINAERSVQGTNEAVRTRNAALATELQPIDHVTPLGERGPPIQPVSEDLEYGTSTNTGTYEAAHGLRVFVEEVTLR